MKTTTITEWTANGLADKLERAGIGYDAADLKAAVRYLNGSRTCADYDRLSDWVKMIVDEVTL